MSYRKTIRNFTAALAAAALLIAASDAATAAHANRSPTTGGATTTTAKPVKPNYGSGGHPWCYWHPYQCRSH
ncbi:hypothetical protein JQ543_12945 [Bradyrhizobium diazoefficiens]|nr:hypothetical protein [Bradyrhizobium diazoefficiens]MBR0848653.1 hypothetical protein [Bradyrhizobium diazoefficiens]